MPADTLADTVRRYNASIDQGLERDPDFGRLLAKCWKVEKPPSFALQFFPLARKNFGGVKTDLRCQVLAAGVV